MPISYRDAGVDIDAGEELVRRIAPLARATRTPEVLADVGGFAGMLAVPAGMREPVLVSGTDGVGTKLEVAFLTGVHDTVGLDLVAMCVNDVVTVGARPLFFLDYFAAGRLDVGIAEAVIRGIARGCSDAGCALLGGETAELPGMYAEGTYDLAGFAVGVVERSAILQPTAVHPGDALIAVASSGLHSNGYSLARKVLLERLGLRPEDELPTEPTTAARDDGPRPSVGAALLRPTRIYARAVGALAGVLGPALHGLAHITGGGLRDNVPRALPLGLRARVRLDSYRRPAIFRAIQRGGPVDEDEMRRTFNLGVGLVAVVSSSAAREAMATLGRAGERAWLLGEVVTGTPGAEPDVLFE
jgi:phosphoribosylformylglycinamidine cyclo-ligase